MAGNNVKSLQLLFLLGLSVYSGTSTRTQFTPNVNGSADSNMAVAQQGVGLAVRYAATLKLFGDTLPGTPNRSYYPDVTIAGEDVFDVHYVDTTVFIPRVVTQRLIVAPTGAVTAGFPAKWFDCRDVAATNYFHADAGTDGKLGSIIKVRTDNNFPYLQLNNGTAWRNVDTTQKFGFLYTSQNILSGDTFLVVSCIDAERALLRKVYSNGAALTVMQGVDAFSGVKKADSSLLNCTVAADSTGTIFAGVIRGGPSNPKYFEYGFFERDLTPGPKGRYAVPIGDNSMYYYDDVTTVAYGQRKFATVSWDAQGVVLHTFTTDGTTIDHKTTRIINKAGVKFCTIAASKRYMVVACRGDLDGNGVRGIEGIRYKIVNGEPDSGLGISFSDRTIPVLHPDSSTSSAINSVVDDSGTMALVWRNQYKIAACIWAERPVRFDRGYYMSPVESLTSTVDSLQFYPVAAPLTSTTSWNSECYLRYGATPAACTNASWISFTDSLLLSRNRTAHCYYQYKTYCNRNTGGSIDSFSTPYFQSIRVSWNTQPRRPGIDSVVVGGTRYLLPDNNDTLVAVARYDSLFVYAQAYDDDATDSISFTVSVAGLPAVQKVAGGAVRPVKITLYPFDRADTVYRPQFITADRAGWQGEAARLNIRTVNDLPRISARWRNVDGRTGIVDSVRITDDTTLYIAVEDSFGITYSVRDGNDMIAVAGRIQTDLRNNALTVDSITGSETGLFSVAVDTLPVQDTVHYRIEAIDPDTMVAITLHVIVNHPPSITGIVYRGDTLHGSDTANVVIGATARFQVLVNDPDCAWWDTLRYVYHANNRSGDTISHLASASLNIVPGIDDALFSFGVTDRFGRSDSMHIHCAFPWFETDSLKNPRYVQGIHYVNSAVALIAGSDVADSIAIPLLNSGRDVLVLSSFGMMQGSGRWATVRIGEGAGRYTVTTDTAASPEVKVLPDSVAWIRVKFSAKALVGDSILHDTVIFATNDPLHAVMHIPLQIEYNDLPRVISVTPTFLTDVPYRRLTKRAAYQFPPHAAIQIAFSEPMDTGSADSGVMIYSEFDRQSTGMKEPIPIGFEWLQNGSVALVSPHYTKSSPAFRLLPPVGLFIPTDSLVIQLSSALHDRAKTPGGPNRLDVDNDFVRDSSDTAIGMRVDSIGFTIATIDPVPGDLACPRRLAITLTFSTPPYAASVDTALVDNRSFDVHSVYGGDTPLAFSSVVHDSTNVVFTLRQTLFYNDSLTCHYHSRRIRDRLGYAADNNHDGIDATIFDMLATDDDLQWGYRVKSLVVASVSPVAGAVETAVSPEIQIVFNDKLIPGIFDTDTSKRNVSFKIGSGRTGYSSLSRVTVMADSMGISIQPALSFFSNDSVYCQFTGFTDKFRYDRDRNLPEDTSALFSSFSWHFRSGEIGFYTFPNPYLPATDPRHCSASGPCGIWFKNLHTLANELDEVIIKIYTMNAHPVFDSQKKGIRIRFSTQGDAMLPEWKWDTRNDRGEFVVSGIYLYAITDVRGTVLIKGKIVIAR